MLAEIFLLRLESLLRAAATNGSASRVSDPRFVPMALPHA
jgi:hypothetical protein